MIGEALAQSLRKQARLTRFGSDTLEAWVYDDPPSLLTLLGLQVRGHSRGDKPRLELPAKRSQPAPHANVICIITVEYCTVNTMSCNALLSKQLSLYQRCTAK